MRLCEIIDLTKASDKRFHFVVDKTFEEKVEELQNDSQLFDVGTENGKHKDISERRFQIVG